MDEEKTKVIYKIGNIITLVLTILINALANALPLNGLNTGELSDALPNLFVPAGLTFSIWGIIYTLLILFVIYQGVKKGEEETEFLNDIGPWFIISNLGNFGWIFAWHWQQVALSMVFMIVIFISLLMIYLRLGIGVEKGVEKPTVEKFFVQVPFSVYIGWITVATVANVTGLLVDLKINAGLIADFGLDEVTWTILVLIVVGIIADLLIIIRKDFAYSFVIIWALLGIFIKRVVDLNDQPIIGYVALIIIFTVVAADVIAGIRTAMYHHR